MAFSAAFLDELKFRNELPDVISQYVNLKTNRLEYGRTLPVP